MEIIELLIEFLYALLVGILLLMMVVFSIGLLIGVAILLLSIAGMTINF